jgi:hypothetical protein
VDRHAHPPRRGGSGERRRPEAGGGVPDLGGSTGPGALELFCAAHLGITPDDGFKPAPLMEVARRFRMTPSELQELLREHGLDAETVRETGFDMEMARYDIKVAPAGISRRELAKPWFAEYQEALTAVRAKRRAAEPPPAPPPDPPAAELASADPPRERPSLRTLPAIDLRNPGLED